jgi:hypothetical protein
MRADLQLRGLLAIGAIGFLDERPAHCMMLPRRMPP